jgi:PAS domain S-box-containing protein
MAGKNADIEMEAARWFFASSDDIFVVLREGLIERVNPTWQALTGWTEAEVIGQGFTDFAHPDERDLINGIVRSLVEKGHADCEHRLKTKSGRWIWVRAKSKLTPEGMALVVLQNLTEARRHEAESAEAMRTKDLLREEAGIFVWRFDPRTNRYTVNSDLLHQGGRGVPGGRDLTADEMDAEIHPADRDRVSEAFVHTVTTGEPRVVEYRHFRGQDGGWARLRAAWRGMHRHPTGLWEVLGITQDITALAEARDAALAAAEVKARFLANMSHEIRTPMNGVLGVLHLLKREALSEDGRRLLDEALGCGAMLSELLNDVIDFSRLEAGRLELTPEPVDPAGLLESVAALLRPQAQAKGLYLRVTGDAAMAIPAWSRLDPVRLRQILFNLMGNAVKFTPSGGVEARLSILDQDEAQRLRIEIADTGIGIEAEAQASLFERFQQADGSATRRFGGSGLGLAIARGLAQQMGGAIGFDSRPGEGSTFWVEIAAPAAQPGIMAAAPQAEAGEEILTGLKALVVEDNATNRMIVTRMLQHLGAEVSTAEDGRQGVDAAQVAAYDLIFMDIQMPVMDGLAATAAIRALPGPTASAPIIAMTANAMAHQTESYMAAGMNGWISKPLSPAALVRTIVQVLAADWVEAA